MAEILDHDQCSVSQLLTIDNACAQAGSYCTTVSGQEVVDLSAATGRVLANPIIAQLALPPFTQSAMDGYAVQAAQGLAIGTELTVKGRTPAGYTSAPINSDEACRVFTGTQLPLGSDAVIMQEHVLRQGDRITLLRAIRAGDNIRHKGEDVEPLEPLFDAGLKLDARHIALLAAQGIENVSVRRRIRIAVLSTGDELRMPGASLEDAAIYDSNRPMLLSLGRQGGFEMVDAGWVPDNPEILAARLNEFASGVDLIISSGGASVGEEDHSAHAVEKAGGESKILRIALKPGKPAVVGSVGCAAYLGLPGNPVSSLVSWLLIGSAMVAVLEGRSASPRLGCPMTSTTRFDRKPGRTEFAPARLVRTAFGIGAEILGRGGSARLKPLTEADGLAEIAATNSGVQPGDIVIFHPFKDGFVV